MGNSRDLGQRRTLRLVSLLTPERFLSQLKARGRPEAVLELAQLTGTLQMYSADQIAAAAWQREDAAATGIGYGVAVPHARLTGLSKPLVAVGLSHDGIDFDAPDGRLSHVVFLVLTPDNQSEAQLDLQEEIARIFCDRRIWDRAVRAATCAEFVTILGQSASHAGSSPS
ncbi:MAG: PTS sugar transporter subunit IIA [Planctomycetota bacterium]|nr:PTS sugar transporter subunit IIA [Planctomycetota bacterium]MDA1179162.1 PTS sugar transporter subunit IIA [Planctomycetota bacterium]